jgi:hypothetical protein
MYISEVLQSVKNASVFAFRSNSHLNSLFFSAPVIIFLYVI